MGGPARARVAATALLAAVVLAACGPPASDGGGVVYYDCSGIGGPDDVADCPPSDVPTP